MVGDGQMFFLFEPTIFGDNYQGDILDISGASPTNEYNYILVGGL